MIYSFPDGNAGLLQDLRAVWFLLKMARPEGNCLFSVDNIDQQSCFGIEPVLDPVTGNLENARAIGDHDIGRLSRSRRLNGSPCRHPGSRRFLCDVRGRMQRPAPGADRISFGVIGQ